MKFDFRHLDRDQIIRYWRSVVEREIGQSQVPSAAYDIVRVAGADDLDEIFSLDPKLDEIFELAVDLELASPDDPENNGRWRDLVARVNALR